MSTNTATTVIQSGSRKDQIKKLLSSGVSPTTVARTVGVDPSYISQLMADEEFMRDVIEARVVELQSQSTRDAKYDGLEDQLLAGLEAKIDGGITLWKPDAILRAITAINNAKRRGTHQEQTISAPTQIVNLVLPSITVQTFQTNNNMEVIEVDNKGMVGMSASKILQKLQAKDADVISSQLPSPQEKLLNANAHHGNQRPSQEVAIAAATFTAEKI